MYYIKCRCGKRHCINPKEDSNVFLWICGRKIPKRKWQLVIDGEFIETGDNTSLMVI